MATAVQPNTTTTPAKPISAMASGAVGAILILAGIVTASYAVPQIWASAISPVLAPLGSLVDSTLRLTAQVATVGVFVWLGTIVLGASPAKGTRGYIGLILSAIIAIFFIVRAVGLNFAESSIGLPITLVVLGGLLGITYRLLTSPGGVRLATRIEEQGLFSLFTYKKVQGVKARRFTLIGFLLIGWTGVYSLMNHVLFDGNWILDLPFTDFKLTALTDVRYSLPVILGAAVFWVAWRAVNMPTFADFLIATEIEMYKVSWSSRKRLIQDTIVVLVFVIMMTLFLMLVDFFWGWLLSSSWIQVLPPKTAPTTTEIIDPIQGRQLKW
jgi:preprotein translocase SecE subunit